MTGNQKLKNYRKREWGLCHRQERIGFVLVYGHPSVDDCARNFIFPGADSLSVGNPRLYHTREEFSHSPFSGLRAKRIRLKKVKREK